MCANERRNERLLLHVVLASIDVLQPQKLLRAVEGVRGKGRWAHLLGSRPTGKKAQKPSDQHWNRIKSTIRVDSQQKPDKVYVRLATDTDVSCESQSPKKQTPAASACLANLQLK